MYFEKFQNANASKISVTSTATDIFDLINTAGSTTATRAGFSSNVNGIIINPEDGDIRVLFDGNTPTASVGFLIKQGSPQIYCNVPLDKLKLIRTGSSNVAVSIAIGSCKEGESSSFGGSSTVTFSSSSSPITASTATLSSVTSSASTGVVLAANTSRKNATFFNESTAILYLAFAATATTTAYTVQIAASGYYELPIGSVYTGVISGIWSSANGACRVTELT